IFRDHLQLLHLLHREPLLQFFVLGRESLDPLFQLFILLLDLLKRLQPSLVLCHLGRQLLVFLFQFFGLLLLEDIVL
ncbi:hypothetical protein PMAYCL1PPCAC_26442, partial [Pristionchus mayeri]